MADILTPTIAALATVGAAIGGPAIASFLQNRKEVRLRQAVITNFELHSLAKNGPERVRPSADSIEKLMEEQLATLVALERKAMEREPDWSSLGAVVFILFATGWLPVWLWSLKPWWTTALAYASGLIILMLLIVGLFATFRPTQRRRGQTGAAPPVQS